MNLFKKKSKITVGVSVTRCDDCQKLNTGKAICDSFTWNCERLPRAIKYDKEHQEILLNEHEIMRIIQMVNPAQEPRPLKMVSQDEFYGL